MICPSPFKFLDPFELDDRDVFFGRDAEIQELYRQVLRTRLLILYGLSGTGKTSLIQCGLAGEFDGPDWLPLWIRMRSDINESLKSSIIKALPNAEGSITKQIRQLYKRYLRPAYLIFDQFEELFILGNEDERLIFANTLQELMEEDLPCTVIIVIREEYLGRLYPIESNIPNLFDFRMRVEPMNTKNVKTVLKESFVEYNIWVTEKDGILVRGEDEEEKRYEEVIGKVSRERSGIELTDLQIYLDQFYRQEFKLTYPNESAPSEDEWPILYFTKEKIEAFGSIDDVLSRFMDEQKDSIQELLKNEDQATPEDTVKLVLNGFVSPEGKKRPIKYSTTGRLIQVTNEQRGFFPALLTDPILSLCLSELERVKIIRAEGDYMELRHDNLAQKIYNERTAEQQKKDNLKIIIKAALDTPQGTREYLTLNQLAGFEEVVPLLEPKEKEFFEESIKYREQEKDAELQKEKERNAILADERNKADEARKVAETAKNDADIQAQKTKRWLIVAVVALGLACIGIVFAYYQYTRSEKNLAAADSAIRANKKIIDAFYFYNDRFAIAQKLNEYNENKYGFINKQGDPIIDYVYDEVTQFSDIDGFARVKLNGKRYLLDTLKNQYLLATTLKEITDQTTALDLSAGNLFFIPPAIFKNSKIKILLLGENYINKYISEQISKLTSLTYLDLRYTSHDHLPFQIEKLTALTVLNLSGNGIDSLPPQIKKLTKLTTLDLSGNKFKSFPPQIEKLTSLTSLDLGNNKLKTIPSLIGKLPKLTTLYLNGNELMTISPLIEKLTSLTSLDMGFNQLDSLPFQIEKLTNLTKLTLSGNKFKSFPSKIEKLTGLTMLELSFIGFDRVPPPDRRANQSDIVGLVQQ